MPKCTNCGGSFGLIELRSGQCRDCRKEISEREKQELDRTTAVCKSCGERKPCNLLTKGFCYNCATTQPPKMEDDPRIIDMPITTGLDVPGNEISKILGVIGAEAAVGLNIFKDIANNYRDFFGGRSTTTQNALKDVRKRCLFELKKEAFLIGADAVIAVKFEFNELSTIQGGGILFVVATGTAVKMEPR